VKAASMGSATKLRVRITEASACPALSELGVFADAS
jgi:hypothetical protein